MITQKAFNAAKGLAAERFISRGDYPVLPADRLLSQTIAPKRSGLRGDYDMLCMNLRGATGAVSVPCVEMFCRCACCPLGSLHMMYPGQVFLCCEVRVVSPNGSGHGDEVQPSEIHGVEDYVR